jgi:hypothetical protein
MGAAKGDTVARRPRDYRREEQRRNELAKARGLRNRYELRKKKDLGEIPKASRVKRTPADIARDAGFPSYSRYRKARRDAAEWSRRHSLKDVSKYTPTMDATTFRAYYDAFVNKEPGTSFQTLTKGQRTTPAIRHFFVDVIRYFTAEEYDERYS